MTKANLASTKSLSSEAVRGTFWSYLAFASGKLLNFVTTLILAYLLVPEQFGLVGYCTIAIQYLDILNTAGINSALVARKEKLAEAANAAFIINVVMGIVSFGIAWLAAPLIAKYFQSAQVTDLFRLLAVVLPISGLGLVPGTLIQRKLRFKVRLIVDVARNISKGLTSILLALAGWGPWSLVWGQIVGECATLVLSWILADWKPSWKFEWQVTKGLLGYGSHIIIIGFAGALQDNVDYIIVGKKLGDAALGLYTMAYRIPELTIRSLNSVAASVLFPILSRTQSDAESLRRFYFGYIRYVSLFTFSFGAGLAMTSGLFVKTFMSNRWEPSILPMMLIAIALAIGSMAYTPGVLYKAINQPEILTRVNMVKLPVSIVILLVSSRWGINGVAAGQIMVAIFAVSLETFVVSRIVRFTFRDFLQSLAPTAISAGIMAGVLRLIQIFFSPSGWVGFVIMIVLGITVYAIAVSLISRETAVQVYATLRKEVLHKWLPQHT
jgi:lipopolysaccharide exporter